MNLRSVKIVRAAWPKAICMTKKEYMELSNPIEKEGKNRPTYYIYDSDFSGAIGWGPDIKSAWKEAADWVNKEMLRKLES